MRTAHAVSLEKQKKKGSGRRRQPSTRVTKANDAVERPGAHYWITRPANLTAVLGNDQTTRHSANVTLTRDSFDYLPLLVRLVWCTE